MALLNTKNHKSGFTLIEIMMVMVILGLLATVIIVIGRNTMQSAKIKKTAQDLRALTNAIELYFDRYEHYPADVSRGLPSGIEVFLTSGKLPKGLWNDTCYDWDNWVDPVTGGKIRQMSLRFCCTQGSTGCKPPIANFDYYSAIYYCLQGACRAHSSKPITHPALCVNCGKPI